MFDEIAKTFLEFLKLAPRYLIALGVMAAILLFASEEFLKLIGVFELAQDNRSVLGLTLLVSVSLFTFWLVLTGFPSLKVGGVSGASISA